MIMMRMTTAVAVTISRIQFVRENRGTAQERRSLNGGTQMTRIKGTITDQDFGTTEYTEGTERRGTLIRANLR